MELNKYKINDKINHYEKEFKSVKRTKRFYSFFKGLGKFFFILIIFTLVCSLIYGIGVKFNKDLPNAVFTIFWILFFSALLCYFISLLFYVFLHDKKKAKLLDNLVDNKLRHIFYEVGGRLDNSLILPCIDDILRDTKKVLNKGDNYTYDLGLYLNMLFAKNTIDFLEEKGNLMVVPKDSSKEDFINKLSEHDIYVKLNKIKSSSNVSRFIERSNKEIINDNIGILNLCIKGVYNDKFILFIVNFKDMFNLLELPGVNYIDGKKLFKKNPELELKYELSLLIQKYENIDNCKDKLLKKHKNNKELVDKINECSSFQDLLELKKSNLI